MADSDNSLYGSAPVPVGVGHHAVLTLFYTNQPPSQEAIIVVPARPGAGRGAMTFARLDRCPRLRSGGGILPTGRAVGQPLATARRAGTPAAAGRPSITRESIRAESARTPGVAGHRQTPEFGSKSRMGLEARRPIIPCHPL